MALDGEKRQVDAIGSNAGPVPLDRDRVAGPRPRRRRPAARARRCLAAGGSGRTPRTSPATTRSATTPGTVWPHDTSLTAAGLKRYGFDDEANRLVGHVFEAAQHFPAFRLPELFCGFDRDSTADAGAVPGRLLAAGLGGRRVVPVPPDDARPAGARRPARAGAAPAEPARLARQGARSRTSGSATRRSTCCSTAGAGRRPRRSCARSATSR